jgi:2,3-bisphosphoglycerate-independent phosphoglycerate mutase
MKYVVCVPDGCADEPVPELDGRTPLDAASMPTLDALAARGEVGRAAVIPPGLPPGSDVGNMAILGYDPTSFHTGRAPIEAASLGLTLATGQVAFRCNLVTIGDDGTMVDFAGGHPSTHQAAEVVAALAAELGGDGIEFHPGVEYRHIMVAPAALADAECVPPHDLTGMPAQWPTGPASTPLRGLMEASRPVLSRFDLDANQIWLWGQGIQPQLPSFGERWGLEAGLCSAVDLVRGLGVLSGIEVIDVDGMTAGYETDYVAQRDCALDALGDGADLFLLHVEATDEAGHAGDVDQKVRSLERWDAEILAALVSGLDRMGECRLLWLADHATPLGLRTHTAEPVPYLLVGSGVAPSGPDRCTETAVAGLAPVAGHELMGRLVVGH